jgi:hypothetical protein
MRYFILASALIGTLLIAGCTPSRSSGNDKERDAGHLCNEPENPYAEGTGHYAGHEWAEDHGSGTCDGLSQSFNEGCEEYETQEAEYQACEAQNKN